jgi:uncharacterized membrane protein YphA (DoxX/SURF4 family)
MSTVRRFRELPLPPQIIAIGAVLIVASVAAGFAIDPTSFALHMLSEVAGIFGGVLLGALYVDALLERERGKRWREVSASTAKTLRFTSVKAAQSIYMLLPAPRDADADPFLANEDGELARGLRCLEAAIDNEEFIVSGLDIDAPAALAMLEPRLRVIREVILPRLLAIGVVPMLVSALLAVESAQEMLDYNASMHWSFGTPSSMLMDDLKHVVGSLAVVAEVVDASLG